MLTNEVFKWTPGADDFEFAGKSYLLEKIMIKTNMSQEGIREELKQRKRVLDWMVLNGIRSRDKVAQLITEYYTRTAELMQRVEGR